MCNGTSAHFLHDLSTMDFNGALAESQVNGDDFICTAFNDQVHDLPFARGQRFETMRNLCAPSDAFAIFGILLQSVVDAIEQLLIAERFLYEFEGAFLHGLYRHWNVAMSSDKDHRKH